MTPIYPLDEINEQLEMCKELRSASARPPCQAVRHISIPNVMELLYGWPLPNPYTASVDSPSAIWCCSCADPRVADELALSIDQANLLLE